jgi:hypothetical protein
MATNLSSETGLSGQTAKQSEMSRAFSPSNNNRQNMQEEITIRPEKSGVVKAEESKQTQESVTGVPSPAQQNRTVQSAAGMPEVQAMLGNLGIFNIGLTAGVNRFVNSAPFSSANAQLTKGGTPVFNQATGQWELPEATEVQAQTSGLVGEKLGQQEELRQMAGDMFNEDGTAKTFEQVLKKFGDRNGDGVIDAQEQQWLNESFGIVNGIRRLQNENPYSAQAQALRAELAAKDRNGMVSGLMQALEEYDRIVNKRVTGAEAEAYYLKDLLTMGQDKIEAEVQKALTASSGLFGSDYETYLTRELDKSAQEYQDAAKEDATVMQVIKDVADAWLRMYEGEFRKAKDTLNTMFKGASDGLIANLEELKKTGNKGIDQAKEWFVDTQTLVNTGNKDFGEIIFQALVDSPLGAESKRIIKKWLGETIGKDVAEKGILSALLEKIGTTGYFWTEDANGNQVQVYLNAQQKMDVVRIINDKNLTDQQKVDEIEGFVNAMSKGMGTRLEQDLSTVVTPIKSGRLATALTNWNSAMTESFAGFDDSLVQAGYGSTVQAMGRNNSPQVMQAAIEQHAQKKLDEITAALTEIHKTIGELETKVAGDRQLLAQNVGAVSSLAQTGRESVSTNWASGFENYANIAKTKTQETSINGQPATPIEAYWVQSKGAAKMPANINEIYAPIQAARSMVKNLRGTADEDIKTAYEILLRDYYGGDAGKVDYMINANLFDPDVAAYAQKAIQAFKSLEFTDKIWQNTRASQALTQRQQENTNMLTEADNKLNEAKAAKAALDASYQQAVKALNTSTRGATISTAQAYNAAVDGNFAPLLSNVPQETANRLFNMAIEGQSMPFQQMPKIDINALRATGNIKYVERGRSLDPAGLEQYVQKEWVPAEHKIATSMPKTQVGPGMPAREKIKEPVGPVQAIQPDAPTQGTISEPTDRNQSRVQATPEKQPTITEILPTGNPNTVIIKTSDGKQRVANVSQTPNGPVIVDSEGGVNPMYPPAGVSVERLSTDPNTNYTPVVGQQAPEQPKTSGWMERILESLKPGFTQPTQAEKDKATAAAVVAEQEKVKQADIAAAKQQGAVDARFGAPPAQGKPAEYYEAYQTTKEAIEEIDSRKTPVPQQNTNDQDRDRPTTPSSSGGSGPQQPRQDFRNI